VGEDLNKSHPVVHTFFKVYNRYLPLDALKTIEVCLKNRNVLKIVFPVFVFLGFEPLPISYASGVMLTYEAKLTSAEFDGSWREKPFLHRPSAQVKRLWPNCCLN
jgi:hypothetical protein